MSKRLLSTTILLTAMLWLGNMFNVKAADKFVSFSPANDAWQLHDITLGYAASEHSCVQRAAASLATDFEQVTGTRPASSDNPMYRGPVDSDNQRR